MEWVVLQVALLKQENVKTKLKHQCQSPLTKSIKNEFSNHPAYLNEMKMYKAMLYNLLFSHC